MKKLSCFISTFLLFFVLVFSVESTYGQLWKKIKSEVKNRAENNVVNKAGNTTDKAIDNTADAAKGNKSTNKSVADNAGNQNTSDVEGPVNNNVKKIGNYENYDFVPGDKIIFQPDLRSESDAELPARFTIFEGNAEIQSYEGEKILHIDHGARTVVLPLMDSKNYLPEQFTIEMDIMYEKNTESASTYNTFGVELRKPNDNLHGTPPHNLVLVSNDRYEWGDVNTSRNKLPEALVKSLQTPDTWHHIAIYVRKNIGKAYVDQYRVAASNTLTTGFGFIDIKSDGNAGFKIKNFRLAAGGDDKYNKIVTEGKFITHGILFDVNKSSIKPESMGALNEIVKMMKEHNDLKFEIDGHTDSDGKPDANLKLSQDRADAVKAKLTEMGIDDARLTTKGFGATKPIDKNDSAEGKANNRRVEFVKM